MKILKDGTNVGLIYIKEWFDLLITDMNLVNDLCSVTSSINSKRGSFTQRLFFIFSIVKLFRRNSMRFDLKKIFVLLMNIFVISMEISL
jgi:hypothetical protein